MDRYLKNITIRQMRALVCLAEERSFSRAARKMYLTQPSLTKHIKNLEEQTGVQLVDRKSRGLSLTPEGRILFESAKRVFGLIDDTGERITRIKENESGSIRIAASTIPATYILPRSLSTFRCRHKDIHCYVRGNDSDITLDMILNDEAEIGFIGKEIAGKKLCSESLWKDRLVLAVPASHKWNERDGVSMEEVSSEPFVSRERGSATRTVLEEYLRKNTNHTLSGFNIVCELGSSAAVKEAVLAGLGVSIISIHAVGREIEDGLIVEIPVENCTIERNFYMVYKARIGLMKHHGIFLDFIRNYEMDARHEK
ncbi:MAG: selenium metabolism-associated LysR family transcriptional regulator [Thermodesulfobacteriota bacterium]|nr:selenium metabolism-associated LysR family transcriptional regulator [Thermodesulfobacteriota bacterium]